MENTSVSNVVRTLDVDLVVKVQINNSSGKLALKMLVSNKLAIITSSLSDYEIQFSPTLSKSGQISLLYTYSLPNYYESTIRLAPELPSKYVGLGSLFEMVKFMDLDAMSGRAENDFAMYPRKFPIIMNNIEFQTTLFSIKVKRESDGKEFYYYDYLLREQKKTWWKKGFQKISTLLTRKETIIPKPYDPKTVSSFKLNEDQIKVADAISSKVHVKVDPYDMVVSISVTDQDPLIAATVADSVKAHLQTFLIKYQTRKAQADLDYGRCKS